MCTGRAKKTVPFMIFSRQWLEWSSFLI